MDQDSEQMWNSLANTDMQDGTGDLDVTGMQNMVPESQVQAQAVGQDVSFGGESTYGNTDTGYDDYESRMLANAAKKKKKLYVLGGLGLLVVVLLIFIAAIALRKGKPQGNQTVGQQLSSGKTQVTQPQVTQPQVTQPQVTQPQVTQPQVQKPVVVPGSEWLVVRDLAGFDYKGKVQGSFTIDKLELRVKSGGGLQGESVGLGSLEGLEGTYEVRIPRSSLAYAGLTAGASYIVTYDLYMSAEGKLLVENINLKN